MSDQKLKVMGRLERYNYLSPVWKITLIGYTDTFFRKYSAGKFKSQGAAMGHGVAVAKILGWKITDWKVIDE